MAVSAVDKMTGLITDQTVQVELQFPQQLWSLGNSLSQNQVHLFDATTVKGDHLALALEKKQEGMNLLFQGVVTSVFETLDDRWRLAIKSLVTPVEQPVVDTAQKSPLDVTQVSPNDLTSADNPSKPLRGCDLEKDRKEPEVTKSKKQSEKLAFMCSSCGYICGTEKGLRKHLVRDHRLSEDEYQSVVEQYADLLKDLPASDTLSATGQEEQGVESDASCQLSDKDCETKMECKIESHSTSIDSNDTTVEQPHQSEIEQENCLFGKEIESCQYSDTSSVNQTFEITNCTMNLNTENVDECSPRGDFLSLRDKGHVHNDQLVTSRPLEFLEADINQVLDMPSLTMEQDVEEGDAETDLSGPSEKAKQADTDRVVAKANVSDISEHSQQARVESPLRRSSRIGYKRKRNVCSVTQRKQCTIKKEPVENKAKDDVVKGESEPRGRSMDEAPENSLSSDMRITETSRVATVADHVTCQACSKQFRQMRHLIVHLQVSHQRLSNYEEMLNTARQMARRDKIVGRHRSTGKINQTERETSHQYITTPGCVVALNRIDANTDQLTTIAIESPDVTMTACEEIVQLAQSSAISEPCCTENDQTVTTSFIGNQPDFFATVIERPGEEHDEIVTSYLPNEVDRFAPCPAENVEPSVDDVERGASYPVDDVAQIASCAEELVTVCPADGVERISPCQPDEVESTRDQISPENEYIDGTCANVDREMTESKTQVPKKKRKPRTKASSSDVEAFVCDVCNKAFVKRCSLIPHFEKAHQNHPEFAQKMLELRTRTNLSPVILFCPVCDERFHGTAVFKHLKLAHGNVLDLSTLMAATRKRYRLEYMKHFNYDRWGVNCVKCPDCQEQVQQRYLKHHLKFKCRQNPERAQRMRCKVCGYSSHIEERFKRHMEKHVEGQREYMCEVCGKAYTGRSGLLIHKRTQHKIANKHPVQCWQCSVCNKQFYLKHHIERHMRTHTDVRTVNCPVCGKSLKSEESLKRHTKTQHLGQYRYKCNDCGHGIDRRVDLHRHKCGSIRHPNQSNIKHTIVKLENLSESQVVIEDPDLVKLVSTSLMVDGQEYDVICPESEPTALEVLSTLGSQFAGQQE